jgi:hypothetical protein
VIDRVGTLPEILQQLLVADHARPGIQLLGDDIGERRGGCDLPQQATPGTRLLEIALGREVIWADDGCDTRIARADMQYATTRGSTGI